MKGEFRMKLKVTEYNGAMAFILEGKKQELIICEEDDGFTIELRQGGCQVALPVFSLENAREEESASASVSTVAPTAALEDIREESNCIVVPKVVEEEGHTATIELKPESTQEYSLFLKLAELRKELATADGVPPYLVFHNKTLQEMAKKMPQDLQTLSKISGVGQAKLEKYGAIFLEAICGVAV